MKDVAPLPGYQEPYGLLCATLQDATVEWRTELWDDFGAEVTTWQARPDGPSIGALILHMINAELYWFEQFALGRSVAEDDRKLLLWDEIDVDSCVWPKAPVQPLAWYYNLQDRYRARALEAVKDWPSPDTVKVHGGNGEVTLRWVLGHVVQHEAYHGGQIVMLYDLWKHRSTG